MHREAFLVSNPSHQALRALNYSPAIDALRGSARSAVPLGDAAGEIGLGYATVFARRDCAPELGVELLSQADMFAVEPAGRWIRRDSMNSPERHEVRRWQILLAGAGTLGETELYGRAVLADNRLTGKYVGQDTLVIAFEEPGSDLNLFTYAFLASPTGVKAIRSSSSGTKILRLRKDILAALPIPLAEPATVRRVAGLVRTTVAARERHWNSLRAARDVIEGLTEMLEAKRECAERRARCVLWGGGLPTIGAWNYASVGAALPALWRRWSARVGDVVPEEGISYGLRSARIPCHEPFGVPFLAQRDVFLVRPIAKRVLRPRGPHKALYASPGTILMAGRGTLGEGEIFARPVLVSRHLSTFVLTEDLLRIRPETSAAALVYSFFSTLVGRRLLRSTAVGTKILNLRADLLRRLPLPELDAPRGATVAGLIDAAVASGDEAIDAESEAIRIIEEEVLPQWLA